MNVPEWVLPGQHWWSGWPGAICVKCGAEDQVEVCVATCPDAFSDCVLCEKGCDFCFGTGVIPGDCTKHVNDRCPK